MGHGIFKKEIEGRGGGEGREEGRERKDVREILRKSDDDIRKG